MLPDGLKWTFMPKNTDKLKYLCVNGDESEPGTFKDREIFESNPHLLIEGIMIACYAMGVKTAYLYIEESTIGGSRLSRRPSTKRTQKAMSGRGSSGRGSVPISSFIAGREPIFAVKNLH